MNYEETCEYLYHQMPMFERQGASGYKEGLSNTLALDEHFGHPHQAYKTIHVGGTNGKGSVSHTIAAVLQESGYRIGLYTSPHLIDFRERIRVNGQPISEQYVVDFVEKEGGERDAVDGLEVIRQVDGEGGEFAQGLELEQEGEDGEDGSEQEQPYEFSRCRHDGHRW